MKASTDLSYGIRAFIHISVTFIAVRCKHWDELLARASRPSPIEPKTTPLVARNSTAQTKTAIERDGKAT
jgi:hypothetical protein